MDKYDEKIEQFALELEDTNYCDWPFKIKQFLRVMAVAVKPHGGQPKAVGGIRQCTICREHRALSEFRSTAPQVKKKALYPKYKDARCRPCHNAYLREWKRQKRAALRAERKS